MHRQRVESGVLRSVGYDAVARVLELEFADGAVYRYLDVPASLHAGLMTADSHGTFFLDLSLIHI